MITSGSGATYFRSLSTKP